ncbi:CDP-alcohol phosphatidyltransferase family protein [Cetobacterium somerae]
MDNKRRPIKSRETNLAQKGTNFLIKLKLTPNTISILSICFSLVASIFILKLKTTINYMYILMIILGIQGRLLCNLFDGMVAIQTEKNSPIGELFNEIPDRVSDTLIILPFGYITELPYSIETAFIGIFLSLFTAYIRVFGTSLGITTFKGPMAKQQRMALLTFLLIIISLLKLINVNLLVIQYVILGMLYSLNIGCIITIYNRLYIIVRFLHQKEKGKDYEIK